jgi:protein XagA
VAISNRIGLGLGFGLGLLGPSPAALAGAWTLDSGVGQALVSGTLSTSDLVFDSARQTQSAARYNKFEAEALLEYGVTDHFTAILGPGVQDIHIDAPVNAQRAGLGYTELGGRYQLLQADSWVMSGQVLLRLPGTTDNANPAAIGYTDVQTDVRALLGHSFVLGSMPAFIDLEAAQRFCSAGAPDEFHADLTFGLRPAPRWLLLVQSFNVLSEGSGTWGYSSYDYEKAQLSVVYSLTAALSLQVGGFSTYAGRNALQENGLVLGAWFRF